MVASDKDTGEERLKVEAQNGLEEQVQKLLDPIAANLDLIIESVEFKERQVPPSLRVTVDRREGTDSPSLDQISDISRLISEELDRADPIPSEYLLEVTTPGAHSNLTRPRHYLRNIGRTVQVRLRTGETLEGRLQEADDQGFVLHVSDGDRAVEYDEVRRARPRVDFGGERR